MKLSERASRGKPPVRYEDEYADLVHSQQTIRKRNTTRITKSHNQQVNAIRRTTVPTSHSHEDNQPKCEGARNKLFTPITIRSATGNSRKSATGGTLRSRSRQPNALNNQIIHQNTGVNYEITGNQQRPFDSRKQAPLGYEYDDQATVVDNEIADIRNILAYSLFPSHQGDDMQSPETGDPIPSLPESFSWSFVFKPAERSLSEQHPYIESCESAIGPRNRGDPGNDTKAGPEDDVTPIVHPKTALQVPHHSLYAAINLRLLNERDSVVYELGSQRTVSTQVTRSSHMTSVRRSGMNQLVSVDEGVIAWLIRESIVPDS